MSCQVYVGSLDFRVSENDLEDHMRSAGEVLSINLFRGPDGNNRGSAIVEYKSAEGAQMAISALNDTQLGERLIFVREDRGKGAKGGGFGKGKGGGKGFDGAKGGGFGKGKGWGKGFDGASDGYAKGGCSGKGKGGGPGRFGSRDQGKLVYVGNLPFRASAQEVEDTFGMHGAVVRADIPVADDGRSKGFATVLFEREEDAQAAVDALNDVEFLGRTMRVRLYNIY